MSFKLWRCFRRRAFARISIMERFGESSINKGASEISPIRRARRDHSSSESVPARMLFKPTRASAESIRIVISDLDISREKMTEVCPS